MEIETVADVIQTPIANPEIDLLHEDANSGLQTEKRVNLKKQKQKLQEQPTRRSARERPQPKCETQTPVKVAQPMKAKPLYETSSEFQECHQKLERTMAIFRKLELLGYPCIDRKIEVNEEKFRSMTEIEQETFIKSLASTWAEVWVPIQGKNQLSLLKQELQKVCPTSWSEDKWDSIMLAQVKEYVDDMPSEFERRIFDYNELFKLFERPTPPELTNDQIAICFYKLESKIDLKKSINKEIVPVKLVVNVRAVRRFIDKIRYAMVDLSQKLNPTIKSKEKEDEWLESYRKLNEKLNIATQATLVLHEIKTKVEKELKEKKPKEPKEPKKPKEKVPKEEQPSKEVKIKEKTEEKKQKVIQKNVQKNTLFNYVITPKDVYLKKIEEAQLEKQQNEKMEEEIHHETTPPVEVPVKQQITKFFTKKDNSAQKLSSTQNQIFIDEAKYQKFEAFIENFEKMEINDISHYQNPIIKKEPELKKRKIYISLFDSCKVYEGHLMDRFSLQINGRRPFYQDENQNYEIDSEEEVQELLADNCSHSNNSEDSLEEDLPDGEDNKFVVEDGHLSEGEIEDKEDQVNQKMLKFEQKQDPCVAVFRNETNIEEFKKYECIILTQPLKIKLEAKSKVKVPKEAKPKKTKEQKQEKQQQKLQFDQQQQPQ